jgi:hypothetical protein
MEVVASQLGGMQVAIAPPEPGDDDRAPVRRLLGQATGALFTISLACVGSPAVPQQAPPSQLPRQ